MYLLGSLCNVYLYTRKLSPDLDFISWIDDQAYVLLVKFVTQILHCISNSSTIFGALKECKVYLSLDKFHISLGFTVFPGLLNKIYFLCLLIRKILDMSLIEWYRHEL